MTARRRHRPGDTNRLLSVLGVLVIVTIIAIAVIAYRANSGLPFADRYEVAVEVPNANRLIDNADVRIAGVRVGQVMRVEAIAASRRRRPHARLHLALDPSAGPLPVDTSTKVRPASVLGLTYVDLRPGTDSVTVAEGGTLPLRQASRTVELTDLLDIFDRSTARNFRSTVDGLGVGVAGTGPALNAAFGSINAFLPPARAVSRLLSAPPTRLGSFVRAYDATLTALAPVGPELAGIASGGARTFGALARERGALGRAIEAAPDAERATTTAFTRVRPALDGLAELSADLRPAARLLPSALDDANTTLVAGRPMLRGLPGLSRRLGGTLATLDAVSRDPATSGALRKIGDLVKAAVPTIEVNATGQVHCNIIGVWAEGFSDAFSALGVGQGPSLINIGFTEKGALGENVQNAKPSPDVAMNFYPNANERECESGNEPYDGEQIFDNPPGLQDDTTRDTDPPPGVRERARAASLLTDPEGTP